MTCIVDVLPRDCDGADPSRGSERLGEEARSAESERRDDRGHEEETEFRTHPLLLQADRGLSRVPVRFSATVVLRTEREA
jgi:hypothetical protein